MLAVGLPLAIVWVVGIVAISLAVPPSVPMVIQIIVALPWTVGFGWLVGRREGELLRREIRRTLNRHGYPTCLRCGYDLRGSAPNAPCPECGAETDEAWDPEHPRPLKARSQKRDAEGINVRRRG